MDPPTNKQIRKDFLRMAKHAEASKNYHDMVDIMLKLVKATDPGTDLSPKERNLLSVAYKNFISRPLNAWRKLTASAKNRGGATNDANKAELLKAKAEITKACTDVVKLLDRRLLPAATARDSITFYLTMKAEFSWHSAEVKGKKEGDKDENAAGLAYGEAWKTGIWLDSGDPTRLALQLSVAEFYADYLHLPEKARVTAEKAMIEAFVVFEEEPIYSISTFQGGLQMIARLISLTQQIKDQLQGDAAGASNAQPADAASSAVTSSRTPAYVSGDTAASSVASTVPAAASTAPAATTPATASRPHRKGHGGGGQH